MSARVVIAVAAVALTCAAYAQRDPIYRETVVRHARPRAASEKFDPQESDPKLRAAFSAADAAAERRVGNVRRDEKFALKFWAAKKQILREKYGIDWKSPAELNPSFVYEPYGQPRLTAEEIRVITRIVRRHLRQRAEEITSLKRTFEGTAEVWTKIAGMEGGRHYEFRGRGKHWTLTGSHDWLP